MLRMLWMTRPPHIVELWIIMGLAIAIAVLGILS
jgi:hypothetical protein